MYVTRGLGMWNPFSPIVQTVKDLVNPTRPEADRLNLDGLDLFDDARYQEAEKLFTRALVLNEASYGQNHPEVARTLLNLGAVRRELGDLDEAKALCERALVIYEAQDGPSHPHVAQALNDLG